jgi:hypothetical protein
VLREIIWFVRFIIFQIESGLSLRSMKVIKINHQSVFS